MINHKIYHYKNIGKTPKTPIPGNLTTGAILINVFSGGRDFWGILFRMT